jgi:hypothetical protein
MMMGSRRITTSRYLGLGVSGGGKGRGEDGDGRDVRFSASIAIVVFILVAGGEILGEILFDLGVGHAVADARIEFIEGFPLQLVVAVWEEAGGSNGAFESRGPDGERAVVLIVLVQ